MPPLLPTTTIAGILEAFGTQIRCSVHEEVQESIAAFGCFVYIGDESADTNNVEEKSSHCAILR